jgi:hypothetical protein
VRTVTGSEPCSPASILVCGVGKGFIPYAAEILIFFGRLVGDCMMYSCTHANIAMRYVYMLRGSCSRKTRSIQDSPRFASPVTCQRITGFNFSLSLLKYLVS